MLPDPVKLARRLRRLYPRKTIRAAVSSPLVTATDELAKYRNDPVGFARDVLGIELTEDQQRMVRALPGRVKMEAGHNVGKAQPLTTRIETPDGPTYFGNLSVGDFVFGVDGKPVQVTSVYPQGVIKQYRVTFDDHSSTLVAGDHLWTVRGRQGRRNGNSLPQDGWITVTTEELICRGVHRKNGTATARKWEIPRHGPVQFPAQDVLVPAYTMGAWLGDGCTTSSTITSADPEMLVWLDSENDRGVRRLSQKDKCDSIRVYGLKAKLRECGVLGTKVDRKRVPKEYKYNDVPTRLAVLQGLMDTDGTAQEKGTASFTSTSRGLVNDVAWLVRSLGGKAYVRPKFKRNWFTYKEEKKEGKVSWETTVVLPEFPLFRLERKQSRVQTSGRLGWAERMIESISPEGEADMQCITVDAPNGLYLTNDFIVTHNTFLMAVILLWWFYTRNPSVVICNAPKLQHLQDVLWAEVRLIWSRAKRPLPNYFVGPKAPEIYHNPDHWAKGYTTSKGESYQGRHRENMLFLFDEDEGIEPVYWETTGTMYQPDPAAGHGWVASCNPLTTSSQSYLESMKTDVDGKTPKWKLFRLSSLNHPNIVAELGGRPAPIPNAVSIGQVNTWVKDWTTRLDDKEDRVESDIEWPPNSGIWHRPGPRFKGRVQGIRPTEGIDTVWSVAAWDAAIKSKFTPAFCWEQNCGITISLDASGYGDDDAAIHVRCGPLSLHHEAHNGWGPEKTAGRLKELCREYAVWYNRHAQADRPPFSAADVDVVMEFDGGYGIGVHSHRGDAFPRWRGVTVGSASQMYGPDGRLMYRNVRAEMWCEAAKMALAGMMDLSRLDTEVQDRLRIQLLAPYYEIQPDGSRLVEPKKEVKERLGRSPDDADTFLICHHQRTSYLPTVVMRSESDPL